MTKTNMLENFTISVMMKNGMVLVMTKTIIMKTKQMMARVICKLLLDSLHDGLSLGNALLLLP